MKINLGDILDEFEGQGHRSKVKVTRLKNVIFLALDGVACVDTRKMTAKRTFCLE